MVSVDLDSGCARADLGHECAAHHSDEEFRVLVFQGTRENDCPVAFKRDDCRESTFLLYYRRSLWLETII
jgi:hypothetical protein